MLVVCVGAVYISLFDRTTWSSLETIHTSTQANKTALKITSLSDRWCVGSIYKSCLFLDLLTAILSFSFFFFCAVTIVVMIIYSILSFSFSFFFFFAIIGIIRFIIVFIIKTALKITSLSDRWCVGSIYKSCLFLDLLTAILSFSFFFFCAVTIVVMIVYSILSFSFSFSFFFFFAIIGIIRFIIVFIIKTALKITSLSDRWCVGSIFKSCLFLDLLTAILIFSFFFFSAVTIVIIIAILRLKFFRFIIIVVIISSCCYC